MKIAAIPIIPTGLIKAKPKVIEDRYHLESAHIAELALPNTIARGVSLDGVILDKVEISSSKLHKTLLTDVICNECLFFGTDFDGSGLLRIEFNKGMFSGIILSDTGIRDVVFSGVKLNLANFRMAKLVNVRFEDCDLQESDFKEAQLQKVVFSGCDMTGTDFLQAKMHNVDLRGSNITAIRGLTGLRGATIDTTQLIGLANPLAAELGIKIGDLNA